MNDVVAPSTGDPPLQPGARALARRFGNALHVAAPPLLFGLRLSAAVAVALYVAFWLQLDNPSWAGTSAAIVCQPRLGATLRKGWFRMVGTATGATMGVVLVACFPHDRILFLGGLAVWCAACAFAATLLRNFASYAAALAGYTTAIIAGDVLGLTGGADANAAFLLAVARASEICVGIVCASVILAATDVGDARRRLAAQLGDLAVGITVGFTRAMAMIGREPLDTQPVRREFVRRIVALVPVIDEAVGESAEIRYHRPVLDGTTDGLFGALSGLNAVSHHLHGLPAGEIRQDAAPLLDTVPPELRSAAQPGAAERWIGDPCALHRICEQTVRQLAALPAATPSLRLLADGAAETFAGVACALNGLALLAGDPARPVPRPGGLDLRVPDWLPALIDAGRAFVTVGATALFWIVTGWPGGATAVTFAAIVSVLFAPRAEQAYSAAVLFAAGTIADTALAAVVLFAVLPGLGTETFAGFSLVLAACLVPLGALQAWARQAWQIGLFGGMMAMFLPILAPTNPMTYDLQGFYNSSLAIFVGNAIGALAFCLLPPLSPQFRMRRLLALTLRDLRRMAVGRREEDWEGHMHARLSAMPEAATPQQRADLFAALSAGSEIARLCRAARYLGLDRMLAVALAALAEGDSARAIALLARLDDALAAKAASQGVLRARSSVLVLSEALAKHAVYFNAAARP